MDLLGEYKNGNYNVKIYEDGTKIRETEDDEFIPDHAENMDIKICNRCDIGCPMCHENSLPNGKLADIMTEEFIDTLHPFQEVAIGGGNPLCHPDLIPFLYKLKKMNVISNITVNQIHFEKNIALLKELSNKKLIYGLGVSLMNPTESFINSIKEFPNAVIHVINGIVTQSSIAALSNKDLKILILGYKTIGRGNGWFDKNSESILNNENWMKENLKDLMSKFKVISFDNLAIKQLNVKSILTPEEWNTFYMGDDGESTYYIDMVERKFAKSSTARTYERYDLLNNVDDMFNQIRNKRKGTTVCLD